MLRGENIVPARSVRPITILGPLSQKHEFEPPTSLLSLKEGYVKLKCASKNILIEKITTFFKY